MASVKGGEKLEAILKGMAAKLSTGSAVRVGFLEGSTYPDGTSTPMVAAIQEFGSPAQKIPPRPFMRNTIADNGPGWPKALAKILEATNYDAKRSLDLFGHAVADQLQASIITFSTPANAPSTIARKGFDAPLRDSGHLLNSVEVEVKD
ncbi:hypothetical protein [Methylobacterium sp. J-077]|uniref:hypothetical protein n=1 Tax=Methylobacterium sp. J-077 TaxID=2836656 RepID=UPI001FB9D785|nr:hypothetical protein [Methylobacterium sp. J-077]MCJ2126664.1 hypothetical protein [Methylobacterium sp. J-077]